MSDPLDISRLRLRRRIRINATPTELYAAVADVGAMAAWSPELVWARYDDGEGPTAGSWFTGRNRGPKGEWETRSVITRAQPPEVFEWTVIVDGASIGQWTYSFQADGDATVVEVAWQVNNWIPVLGDTDDKLEQLKVHTSEMMETTLAAMADALAASNCPGAEGVSTLDDKVVAITGASSGIGAATARRLAAAGAAVVLGARRTEQLDALAAEIRSEGGRADAVTVDVTRSEDVQRLVDTAVEGWGRLDVLVSSAGIGPISTMSAGRRTDWDAMIDVNVRGVLHGIHAALPVFEQQGRGHFVTIVSTAGLQISPTMAVYAATKNAVRTLLEGLRTESTDGTVKTTAISPGYVRTEFSDSITDPGVRAQIRQGMELAIDPDAVARAVEFVIDQPWEVEIGELTIRPTVQG